MKKTCIIAEAGVNHNGNVETAIRMVDAAKEAGADYIKFQTFIPEKLVSKFAQKADYQKKTTNPKESQLVMLQKLALRENDFIKIYNYCKEINIGFISTPFDMDSIDILIPFDMDFWKIPSGEITNLPYLERIGKTKRPVVLSTGMSDIDEINAAVDILRKKGCCDIKLLHCNTQYPTPYDDVNLNAMLTIRKETGLKVGYSDHTIGIDIPIAAVALGAEIIEKHFTLDRKMNGPDHKASLEPKELRAMVCAIRNIERALGYSDKKTSESELPNKVISRKSIIAARDIKQGETLTDDNITTKRPGCGITPMKWYEVLGTKAIRDFKADELIEI